MTDLTSKAMLQTLSGKKPHRTPVWFMRQAGRYLPEYREIRSTIDSFLSLCYTPKLACEVTLQPLRRFDLDAAILFSDILVVLDALDIQVKFEKTGGPVVEKVTAETLPIFSENRFHQTLSPVYETIDLIKQKLPKHVAFIGFSGAPWTLACYAINGSGNHHFTETRVFAYRYPQVFATLIETLTDAIIVYLEKQIESGVEIIQLFDSWSGILPETEFEQWVIKPTAKIVHALAQKYPHIPVIGFPRGAGYHYERYVEQCQVKAVGIDTCVPLHAMKQLQSKTVVQGNLDPLVLAINAKKAVEETQRMLHQLDQNKMIFNLGHGIVPETPIEHVESVLRTIRDR
ncbi:MAG: uroporphyrinogen decarboxylase [Alphaproteobacteria bacterium]|nr:uroporphyrinogen decarboxylase [Alphaproteobacteria bacterium]